MGDQSDRFAYLLEGRLEVLKEKISLLKYSKLAIIIQE